MLHSRSYESNMNIFCSKFYHLKDFGGLRKINFKRDNLNNNICKLNIT